MWRGRRDPRLLALRGGIPRVFAPSDDGNIKKKVISRGVNTYSTNLKVCLAGLQWVTRIRHNIRRRSRTKDITYSEGGWAGTFGAIFCCFCAGGWVACAFVFDGPG